MAQVTSLAVRKGSTTVKVSNAAYDRVKQYHDATHVPMTNVMDEAIDLWMSTVGEARLEVLGEDSAQA